MSMAENADTPVTGNPVPEADGNTGLEGADASATSELLTNVEPVQGIAEGRLVRGKVVKITAEEILVDIGQKTESALPRNEFLGADGSLAVQLGDMIEVEIVGYDEEEGTVSLSHRRATYRRTWEEIENAFRKESNVRGRVVERTKGGLTVDIGVPAFLPGSQTDVRPLRNPESLLGQEIEARIIKLSRARNNVVLSRKVALEEELNTKKTHLLEQLKEGAELEGRVKSITDYGAFVDLGGMDGLLHVTDLAWGRVAKASDVVRVGQPVRVKVLKYDPEKGRVSLGMKQLTPDPWERVTMAYSAGQRCSGRVVSLTDYGAFVELEPGVEGLVHVSEMAWGRRLKHPSRIVKVGDIVEVVVLEVHGDQRRISLSLKQTLPDPWTTAGERYIAGNSVEGRVRNLTDFGAFVELEDGVDALIHVSDLSWSKNVKHPSEVLRKGQKVQGQILSVDTTRRRISMGIKQLQADAWEGFFAKNQVGCFVKGKVVRMAPFGAFVALDDGIEGLCHSSEMGERGGGAESSALMIGNEYEFRVVRLDPAERRIGLSLNFEAPNDTRAQVGVPESSALNASVEKAAAATGAAAAKPAAVLPLAKAEP
jgi:small subunit ribosomal protein S1